LKYVLFGAAASSVMIYGLSLLYGLTGSLQFEDLAAGLTFAGGRGALTLAALGAVFVGIGFKIAAVPFHLWCPDVFEGANIDVSAFLSVASKGAGLVLLLRLLTLIGSAPAADSAGALRALAIVLGAVGAVTATVGNTGALVQMNIKRLLGYSSIAHAGYMLCLMPLVLIAPGAGRQMAAQALLIYLAVYLFMNLGAFTVAALIQRHTGADEIEAYGGMSRRAPILAATMAVFMVSLIGLPPFAGFVAKLNVMLLLGKAGGGWWWLVGVVAVNTLLSVYYYLRVVRQLYLRPSDAPAFRAGPMGSVLAVGCAAMLLLMLIFFAPLSDLAGRYASIHASPLRPIATAAR
jgi:NADH-quinone oxidoreductase subunit N